MTLLDKFEITNYDIPVYANPVNYANDDSLKYPAFFDK